MKFSDKLKIIQQLTDLTQEELADELDVSFPTINSWINNRSTPRKSSAEHINALYKKHTGQESISDSAFSAKKKIIKDKSKEYPNVLDSILKNSDIYDSFLLNLTYNSNSIEGNTLTEPETAAVIFDNSTIPNKDLVELIEAKNHRTALDFLFDYLKEGNEINEDLVSKLHEKVMNGILPKAGKYRTSSVRIAGSNVATVNPASVPRKMKELFQEIKNQNNDIVYNLAYTHAQFEKIHPFIDGNGRVGRLLMNAQSLKLNLPPVIIENNKKHIYYQALNTAQKEKNFKPLQSFIADSLIKGFKILH